MIRAMCNRKDLRVKFLEKTGYAGGAALTSCFISCFASISAPRQIGDCQSFRMVVSISNMQACKNLRRDGGRNGVVGRIYY